MSVKRVAVFHMPEYLPGPGRPPGGMGLLPSNTFFGGLRDRVLTSIFNRVINQYLAQLNSVRKAFKLPEYQSFTDTYHLADLRLIQTSKAFDAAITPAPKNVRYVGPVLDDPAWSSPLHGSKPGLEGKTEHDSTANLWPKNDTRPLVVVGLSSTFQNQAPLLQRIIDAASTLDIRCLVTLGPAMAQESFALPSNVRTVSAVPHSQVFPLAAAVITHAGHSTVMRALANGLPMVCVPMGRDQLDNAALVQHHGAGLKLSAKTKAKTIAAALKRVMEEPSFTEHATRLKQNILADAQADRALIELEKLAKGSESL